MTDSVELPRLVNGRSYAQEYPASDLPEMQQAMRFVLVKTGGRKFRCVDCDVTGLLELQEVTQLLTVD